MANAEYTPRIHNLDMVFNLDQLQYQLRRREEIRRSIQIQPQIRPQILMSDLERHCEMVGSYKYGLGYPAEEIRTAFAEAAAAALRVFELRGTEDPFPVTILTVDPTKAADDPAFVIGNRQLHPPGTKDYSMTNSRDCLEGIFYALVGGENTVADKLAELMWDPPKARYISPRSEYITPGWVHLAYAVKHLYQGNRADALNELGRVKAVRHDREVAHMATMVLGLVENSDVLFLEGLQELLYWHQKKAKQPLKKNDPDFYFCLPAVALCILAVRRGLIKKTELPGDLYLPLELIPEK